MLEQSQADARLPMTLERLVQALVQGFIGFHHDDPNLHRALFDTVPLSSHVTVRARQLLAATVSMHHWRRLLPADSYPRPQDMRWAPAGRFDWRF